MFFSGFSGSCHSRCELWNLSSVGSGRIPRNHDLDHGATNHSPSSLESCDVSSPATWRSPDSFWPREWLPWRELMEMGDFNIGCLATVINPCTQDSTSCYQLFIHQNGSPSSYTKPCLGYSKFPGKEPRFQTSPASPFDRSHPPARRAASEASPRWARVPGEGGWLDDSGPGVIQKGWILNDSFTNILM